MLGIININYNDIKYMYIIILDIIKFIITIIYKFADLLGLEGLFFYSLKPGLHY